MLIVLDENFTVTAVSDATINQGDAAIGRIQVIAPYPNNVALVASFALPDGTVTPRYPLVSSISATDKTKTIYTLKTPATVFSLLSGAVQVQFFALLPDSGQRNQYSCMLNVKSADTATDNVYKIDDTFICSADMTDGVPQIVQTSDTAGLSVTLDSDNNSYYLTGGLSEKAKTLSVTVSVTYIQPTAIATTATNFTVKKGTPFNLPAYGDIDANTWNQIVSILGGLESNVSQLNNLPVSTITENLDMWTMATGFYKQQKGVSVYLNTAKTESIFAETDDIALIVINESKLNASFVSVYADKSSTGLMPSPPKLIYGYSTGTDFVKNSFVFGDYVTKTEVADMINSAVIETINTPV